MQITEFYQLMWNISVQIWQQLQMCNLRIRKVYRICPVAPIFEIVKNWFEMSLSRWTADIIFIQFHQGGAAAATTYFLTAASCCPPPSLLIADLSPMYADLCLSFSFFSLYLPYTFRNRPLIDPAHRPCLQGLVMLPIAAKKSTYQG